MYQYSVQTLQKCKRSCFVFLSISLQLDTSRSCSYLTPIPEPFHVPCLLLHRFKTPLLTPPYTLDLNCPPCTLQTITDGSTWVVARLRLSMAKPNSWLSSLGGTVDGSFFRCAPWIDQSLPPGHTDQSKTLDGLVFFGFPLRDLFTGKVVICTPTFTFLCISLAYYIFIPWDLEGAKNMDMTWLRRRFMVNLGFLFAFYGFWHWATWGVGWAKRPFKAERVYRVSKVLHNVYYFTLGVIQWTVWEAALAYCFTTGRLPYVSDEMLLQDYRTAVFVVLQVWMGFLYVAQCMNWYIAKV